MKLEFKECIEQKLQNMELEAAADMLKLYEKQCPDDRDLLAYQTIVCLYDNELDEAYRYASLGIRRFPTSEEMYYNIAAVCEAKKEIINALRNYKIALFFHTYMQNQDESVKEDMENRIAVLEDELAELAEKYIQEENIEELLKIQSYMQRSEYSVFGKYEKNSRDDKNKLLGTEYWIEDNDKRYIGLYRAPYPDFVGQENMDLVHAQGEFLDVVNAFQYKVIGETEEYLLPIASSERENIHTFKQEGKAYKVSQYYDKHFNYYRVKNGTCVSSEKKCYYGRPIPLGHNPGRKKLVLNFFLDGLAQEIINGEDFEKLMPNTYRFFKEGTICTNTYSCSEWTYPSLATYASGLDTLHHMMFHSDIDGELPKDIPTLGEYFKSAGYYTSKLDGDWRCIYSYGFARGMDQYVYQVQSMGARAEHEIANVIEHLETFRETDQFLWMSIGDLHDIADGFDLSAAVQKNMTLEERQIDEVGVTSVKQKYSKMKIAAYKKTAAYLDILFQSLFDYILRNYKEDEILVSLFADHGQGYLVPEEQHFLSKERTKVAFMFRGGVPAKVSDELISTADYLPIMCKLAGIPLKNAEISGKLPATFGGMKEREYVITESLHPGDYYCAVVNTKEFAVYFDNMDITDFEGRFHLKDYKVYGFYKNGEVIKEKAILEKYERIILDRIAPYIIYD